MNNYALKTVQLSVPNDNMLSLYQTMSASWTGTLISELLGRLNSNSCWDKVSWGWKSYCVLFLICPSAPSIKPDTHCLIITGRSLLRPEGFLQILVNNDVPYLSLWGSVSNMWLEMSDLKRPKPGRYQIQFLGRHKACLQEAMRHMIFAWKTLPPVFSNWQGSNFWGWGGQDGCNAYLKDTWQII